MRLFDKYLLACTNQRIPMPPQWQNSLGLALGTTEQTYIESNPEPFSSEITGYRFQQDDTLQRGYVHRQVRSLQLDVQAKYLISLYLEALKNHKGLNFVPYFQIGVVSHIVNGYITRAPIIRGNKYSIYGNTTLPVTLRFYSEATGKVFHQEQIGSLTSFAQYLFDPDKYLDDTYLEADDEYLMLEIEGNTKVSILAGEFDNIIVSSKNRIFVSEGKFYPSAAYCNIDYSDKLIPALLDMQITSDSPEELRNLISSQLEGSSIEEKIRNNTTGLYDVDKYLGNKIKCFED